MATQIFINLPIKDLKKSMAFYEAVGFKNNPQFTDDTAAAMALSENIVVMLLTYNKFKEFTPKDIIDAKLEAQENHLVSVPFLSRIGIIRKAQ